MAAALTPPRVTYHPPAIDPPANTGMVGAPLTPAPWLRAAGLPQAWAGQQDWRVLDTDFADGERFLQLWHAWSLDVDACRRLHVVAFSDSPAELDALARAMAAYPAFQTAIGELEQQWFGLLPGFHRLVFAAGRLQLTLCVGPTLTLLRQQSFFADSIVVGAAVTQAMSGSAGAPVPWDLWAIKSLTRLCRRGSTLAVLPDAAIDPRLLRDAGWQLQSGIATTDRAQHAWSADYQPRWQIRSTRAHRARPAAPLSHCVVVGAGLAGAAVADALARRGRPVTVLDAAPTPGSGASGLPVGLFTPQVSRDDGPRSRLTRAGIRMTLVAAHRLLRPGQDWALSGVAHLRDTDAPALPTHWPAAGACWASLARPGERDSGTRRWSPPQGKSALWHATAGWIKPGQLVRAWLAQPGVCFVGDGAVHAVTLEDGQWRLLARDGRLLAEAPQLVVACAGNSLGIVQLALAAAGQQMPTRLPLLTPIPGQVSWAMHGATDADCFARIPVNGTGSVIGHVPQADGAAWFAGATYEAQAEAEAAPAWAVAQGHAQNLARMTRLAPCAARAVAADFAGGRIQAWRATRWTSADRLPIVGAWPLRAAAAQPGLWISTAMGSRGLTYAALCGELVAAQMGAEPLPLEASLHAAIDVQRHWAGTPRQSPTH